VVTYKKHLPDDERAVIEYCQSRGVVDMWAVLNSLSSGGSRAQNRVVRRRLTSAVAALVRSGELRRIKQRQLEYIPHHYDVPVKKVTCAQHVTGGIF
jgi:hypothetical protein